ncbi:TPA: Par-like protein [Aeromonas salmonicida]|nr:Par-like protein [Aeromonas salmonicida]ELI6446279.1 Par-like protein [Aeromonas salmonicida subsp. salmonicida]EKP0245629.1 Par-like protein [Aeromonas salmonicida]EKP0254169.1 Par-like protein [Aeromonas salmonicida]EKP0254438.1 Par-like protein [Aeromonas salmonicida]
MSISFSEKNLRDIDDIIRGEMISSGARANRSDVVRAAVTAFKNQSKSAISALIKEAKLK